MAITPKTSKSETSIENPLPNPNSNPSQSPNPLTHQNPTTNPNANTFPQRPERGPTRKVRTSKRTTKFNERRVSSHSDTAVESLLSASSAPRPSVHASSGPRQNTILAEHGIELMDVIGTGNYAKVRKGYSHEYNRHVAVKIISKVKAPPEYTQKFLPREIEAVKGLHHENLIAFYQSIETSHRVYLIMQFAVNGTLLDHVRAKQYLEEAQARKLFRQLISAIEYIHSKGVVHRDIKCENLLLDERNNLKLIDFGFARKDTRTTDHKVIMSKTFCGSYAYASPEILKGVPYDPFLSDAWACGVVCYAMVFGRLPFDGSNVHVLLKRINSLLVFPKKPQTSNELKTLILRILAPVKTRYRIAQIKVDPWMLIEEKEKDKEKEKEKDKDKDKDNDKDRKPK